MLLELTNFKCFKKKTFTFPDTGLILLFGNSGKGKTSVLEAIYFSLFGGNKNIKTLGSKSAKTRLVYHDLEIIRTTNPKRLTLFYQNKEYDDEIAQKIIDEHFGNSSQFLLTNYITQKDIYSFLNLSSTNKMEFLEQLVCDDKIKNLKEKLKLKIKENKDQLISISSSSKLIEDEFKKKTKIEKTLLIKDELIVNIKLEITSIQSELTVLYKLKTKLEKDYSIFQINSFKKTELDSLVLELKTLICIPFDDDISELKDVYKFLKNQEKYLLYKQEEKKYDELLKEEEETKKKKLKEILNKLNSFTLDCSIDEYKSLLKLKNEPLLSFIQTDIPDEIKKLEKRLYDVNQSKQDKVCPHCNKKFRIINDKLIKTDDIKELPTNEKEMKKKIKDLTLELEKIQSNNNAYNLQVENRKKLNPEIDYEKEITKLTEYTDLKKEYDRIKNQPLSDTLRKIKNNLKEIKIEEEIDTDYTINDLQSIQEDITNKEKIKQKNEMIVKQQDVLKKKIQNITIIDLKEVTKSEIILLENQINDSENKKIQKEEKLKEYLLNNEKYKLYSEYKEWEDKYNNIIKEENKLQVDLKGYNTFLNKVLKAESMLLENIIENINGYLEKHCFKFFENNIYIELKSEKETKKQIKPMINFKLVYKSGNEFDLSHLSGGEYDRLTLLMMLAFNNNIQQQHNLIMLDESISSLDAKTTEEILEVLKEENKLIIVVSHQVGQGEFDCVIEV